LPIKICSDSYIRTRDFLLSSSRELIDSKMHSCGFEPGTSCYHRQKNGPTRIRKEASSIKKWTNSDSKGGVIDKKMDPLGIERRSSMKKMDPLGFEPRTLILKPIKIGPDSELNRGTTGSSSQCLETRPQFLGA
jgi:hypothetical protein